MEVRDSVLKQGWVEKRSNYLKQWRKRWLVLRSHSLSSYKSESCCERPTEQIQLASILDISPSLDSGKDNSFRIDLKSQHYIVSVSSPDLMMDWLQQIKFACDKLRPKRETDVKDQETDQKKEISTKLNGLLEVLSTRESQIQQELEQTQKVLFKKAEDEVAYVQQVHQHISEVFQIFSQIYRNPGIPSQEKLRQLREMSGSAAALSADVVSENTVHAYVNVQLASTILKRSVKIEVENPCEKRVRRTDITRALKWRYNGQRYDSLSFTLSKPVELTAIGFCTPHKPNRITKLLTLRILLGNMATPTLPAMYTHPSVVEIPFLPDESVYKVVLSTKVQLRAGVTYTLAGQLEGDSTYKCVQCLKQVLGDVIWSFSTAQFPTPDHTNRTDVDCGPIADFYYINI